MQRWSAPLALLGRLLLAYIFLKDGVEDLTHYAEVASYMREGGVSPLLLPLVIVTVLGGGLMVAAGFMARWGAAALAGFCVATAFLFHFAGADAGEAIQFQKDLAIAGGFLILAAFGPGDWSLDAWRARRAPNL
jgi:putative oxidoreductase